MDGPGRKSVAGLAIASVTPWVRLEPPDSLTPCQAQAWREIVATKPSEWFKADCAPILEAYCKAITHYRDLSRLMDTPPSDIRELCRLQDAVGRQARLMGELASKLRLTPQARYTAGSAATADRKQGSASKPWSQTA